MGILFRKNIVKSDINTCWSFFSSPSNLSEITPVNIGFSMKDHDGRNMYEGQKISYTVKPLFGFSLLWTTEIKSVKEKKEFVDTQLVGPYKIWHHRHLFKETDHGVEMIDVVHYKLPFGMLGKLIEKLVVRKKVNKIFDYRDRQIKRIFN